MARKYQSANGHPERYRIIGFEGAFHGRTLATLAAGRQREVPRGLRPGRWTASTTSRSATSKALQAPRSRRRPPASSIEPVQGEGGVRVGAAEFLRACAQLCDEHGLLLVFDEVQSGIGRTGKLFAHEWAGITPDIMAVAKGIGGGFPLGACLATEEAAKGMTPGTHGSTFGGNPLAMAVGNAVLDVDAGAGLPRARPARSRCGSSSSWPSSRTRIPTSSRRCAARAC